MACTRMFDCSCRVIAIFCAASLLTLSSAQATPPVNSAPPANREHESMDMDMSMPDHASSGPEQQAAIKDKKESEFNHHLAGLLVVLAGLFLVGEGKLRQHWPWTRFAWPACFLVCGVFLLVFGDTELWPFGPQGWWYGLTHNPEDLQHKAFAAILLALGAIEIERARGVLRTAWAAWVFPPLAAVGSVMLLFHEHHGGAHGIDHMAVMSHIKGEHLNFAITGGSVGLVKGLSELGTRWQSILINIWPLLLIVLGVLLMRYTE